MADSYFVREGDTIVPTEHCGGIWDPSLASGGPVAGLIAHEARRAVEGDELLLARLTVDLVRPVPIAPLQVETQTVVDRRRLKLVDCTVSAEGRPLIRGSAQFLAPSDIDHGLAQPEAAPVPRPDEVVALPPLAGFGRFAATIDGREIRPIPGPQGTILPASWMRLTVGLLPEVPVTPTLTAVILADQSMGMAIMTTKGAGYINSDFTAYFGREPRGEWICQEATTRMLGRGTALGSALMRDLDGPFAQVTAVGVAQDQAMGGG